MLCGEALRKRRLSRFQLNALVVIEINKIVNPFSGVLESPLFLRFHGKPYRVQN